jgi:hypothetical protein
VVTALGCIPLGGRELGSGDVARVGAALWCGYLAIALLGGEEAVFLASHFEFTVWSFPEEFQVPFEDGSFSQADIGNKLTQAVTCIGKNYLQNAMYALCDSLEMVKSIHPEFVKLVAWREGDDVRSGLPTGTYRKASINQEITASVLAVGRGDYSKACDGIIKAIRMLLWVGQTKNMALVVTHTPAKREVEAP